VENKIRRCLTDWCRFKLLDRTFSIFWDTPTIFFKLKTTKKQDKNREKTEKTGKKPFAEPYE